MKKLLSFIIIAITLVSCGEDISVNNYAVFQGVKDNGFWQGGNAKATLEVGNKLTIEASTLTENIALKIPVPTTVINPKNSATFVTYPLGTSSDRQAIYTLTTDTDVFTYKTNIGVGDGEIVIKDYNGSTVSGTFRFNAVNTDPDSEAQEIVNLQEGDFYKVPIVPAAP